MRRRRDMQTIACRVSRSSRREAAAGRGAVWPCITADGVVRTAAALLRPSPGGFGWPLAGGGAPGRHPLICRFSDQAAVCSTLLCVSSLCSVSTILLAAAAGCWLLVGPTSRWGTSTSSAEAALRAPQPMRLVCLSLARHLHSRPAIASIPGVMWWPALRALAACGSAGRRVRPATPCSISCNPRTPNDMALSRGLHSSQSARYGVGVAAAGVPAGAASGRGRSGSVPRRIWPPLTR